jgi:hypothetical protein
VKRIAALATVAGAFGAGSLSPAAAQTSNVVTVGAVNSVADTPFLIADRTGFFRDVGVEVKFQTFASGAGMIAPIGTGQIDVAGGAPAAGLYNAIARGINIKIVADRAILAEATKLDPQTLREMTAAGVKPTGHVNEKSMREDIATFKQHDYITADVPLATVVDMQFVDHANAVLGPRH